MKIAVATENNDPSAEISSQGARALFYLIFGADGHLSEILENPYTSNATRVGPDVANMLINMHVTKVIAGRFGPKFKEALKNNHVECIEQTGIAAQVAKEFID
ncbi:MAG: NifB/NifX family molybdenum-iron cluster-binding protein [Sulfuriflexus sp.]|nr:NifB/NifX family molybdenum-iron cluster-binding protein [Sulfuriflexus sp.]